MQELKFTSCLADPLSLLQGQEKCTSQLIHSRNDTLNRTGKDPVNETVLSWTDTICLWINITNPEKVHTQTQDLLPDQTIPGTSETLCSASSSWATHQTKEQSQEHNLHLAVPVVLLLSRLRVSQWLERMGIGATFYRIVMLAQRHKPMVAPPKTKVTQNSSSITSLVGMTVNGILWL